MDLGQVSPLSSTGMENLLPKLIMMGLIAYGAGLLMDAISNMLYIGTGASLATVMWLLTGIIELSIAGLLFMKMKYILSISAPATDVLFADPVLKYLLYLVPIYVLMKGIGFVQSALVTGIGLIGAAVLIFIVLFLRAKPMLPATALLVNFILTLLIGAFFSLAGFSMAGSSGPNTLLIYSGILGIAVIIIGLGLLITSLAPTATSIKEVMTYIGYLLITIALIAGGALMIRDGIGVANIPFIPGLLRATGVLALVAGIVGGIIAGVLSVVVVVMSFAKMLARISGVPPPPPPPPPT